MLRSSLLAPGRVEVLLGLVKQVLQGLDDRARVAVVRRGVGRAQRVAAVLVLLRALHQSREPLRVLSAQHGRLHHAAERLQDACGPAELQHRGAALPRLALEDADGALQRADHLHQLRLRGREVGLLPLTNVGGRLEVGRAGGSLPRQILNLCCEGRDRAGGLLNRCFQVLSLSLRRLHLVSQVFRAGLTPLAELSIGLLGTLPLADDL
mmetsp:Transcript_73473/g.208164  ORF Transcript_73473/g.208164 Transcript_73473/m.208164 type:complete len:209 (-) Transcript_73473:178-804(-)